MRRHPTPLPTLLCPAALALLLASCGGGDDDAMPTDAASTDTARFIVTLHPAAVAETQRQQARALGVGSARTLAERSVQSVTDRLVAGVPGARAQRLYTHAMQGFATAVPAAQADALIRQWREDPAVLAVEPDLPVTVTAGARTSVGRVLDEQSWGLDRLDQRQLPLDRRFGNPQDGQGVQIYIVDSGISPHQEFGNRLSTAGLDSVRDGRGTTDCNGHGTHVAGIAGGLRAGVAPGATLVPVRVLDCAGSGSLSGVLQGLDWIIANGQRPAVVNISLGSPASPSLDAAVARLVNAGFTVAVAAGNGNADACTQSPAREPAALTIAASTATDARASYSNLGRCVDLFAPGSAIRSATHGDPQGWAVRSGTSMAAPHAAGAAALLLGDRPKLTPAQVAAQLLHQASPGVVTNAGPSTDKLLFAGPSRPLYFPTPADVHVAQVTPLGTPVSRNVWRASITVTVHDESGLPQKDVQVSGQFSNRTSVATCTTSVTGTCVLHSVNMPAATGAVSFAVTALQGPAMTYRPADNPIGSVRIMRP